MDTDTLNSITDCKQCQFWVEYIGKCLKPRAVKCPDGVPQPKQEVAETEYRSLT